jgi:alpha-1,2-mannosyltransferase
VYGRSDRILEAVMRARRTDVLALAILAAFVVPMAVALLLRHDPPVDLAVYLQAGKTFATGGGLYGDGWGSLLAHPLPYTYPPLWAALVAPVSWVPWRAASLLWFAVNVAVLIWVVRLSYERFLATIDRSRRIALAVLVVVLAATTPIGSVFWFGQVGILLVAACLADVVPERTRLPRGVFVGLATAVKLTPGIFVVYWLVTKRWRATCTSVVTTIGLWLAVAAVRPDLAGAYWTRVVFRADLVGDPGFVSNQSIYGALARAGWTGPLWAVLAATVLAVALIRARDAHRGGDELAAATVIGIASLLISPISWINHAVWIVPATGIVLADGRSTSRRLAWGSLIFAFLLRLPDWVASGQLAVGPALGAVLEDAYLWAYAALLLFLPAGRPSSQPAVYGSVGSATPS